MLDQQSRGRLQLGTLTTQPLTISLPPPVRLAVKPVVVLGYLGSGEIAIASGTAGHLRAHAVDEHGQLRELTTPDGCYVVGLWRERPVCLEQSDQQLTLRGSDGAILGTVTGNGLSGLTCTGDRCLVLVFRDPKAQVLELVPGQPPRALALELDVDTYVSGVAAGPLARAPGGALAVTDCHQLAVTGPGGPGDSATRFLPDVPMACAIGWIDDRTLLLVTMVEELRGQLSVRDAVTGSEKAVAPLGTSLVFSLAVAPTPTGARFALVSNELEMVVDELELAGSH